MSTRLTFEEMQAAVGEVLSVFSDTDMSLGSKVTMMNATLLDGGWTSEEYSQALGQWLGLETVPTGSK